MRNVKKKKRRYQEPDTKSIPDRRYWHALPSVPRLYIKFKDNILREKRPTTRCHLQHMVLQVLQLGRRQPGDGVHLLVEPKTARERQAGIRCMRSGPHSSCGVKALAIGVRSTVGARAVELQSFLLCSSSFFLSSCAW